MFKSNISIVSDTVGGAVEHKDICDMWQRHFQSLLKTHLRTPVKSLLRMPFTMFLLIMICLLWLILKDLKTGKSPGMDSHNSELYKDVDDRIYVLFALLFNSMISHGYIPTHLMDSVIIPLKDSKGDISDKYNY